MKIIIAGSRTITCKWIMADAVVQSGFVITEVVSGTAKGADKLGEEWAMEHGVPIKQFPADWDKHGKSAGYKRNVIMANYADCLIAIWDGKSKGTEHMIKIAHDKGLSIHIGLEDDGRELI